MVLTWHGYVCFAFTPVFLEYLSIHSWKGGVANQFPLVICVYFYKNIKPILIIFTTSQKAIIIIKI